MKKPMTQDDVFASSGTLERPFDEMYVSGFRAIKDKKYYPKPERFNYLFNLLTNNMLYVLENAVLPWDEQQQYYASNKVYDAGLNYTALRDNKNKRPKDSPSDWQLEAQLPDGNETIGATAVCDIISAGGVDMPGAPIELGVVEGQDPFSIVDVQPDGTMHLNQGIYSVEVNLRWTIKAGTDQITISIANGGFIKDSVIYPVTDTISIQSFKMTYTGELADPTHGSELRVKVSGAGLDHGDLSGGGSVVITRIK